MLQQTKSSKRIVACTTPLLYLPAVFLWDFLGLSFSTVFSLLFFLLFPEVLAPAQVLLPRFPAAAPSGFLLGFPLACFICAASSSASVGPSPLSVAPESSLPRSPLSGSKPPESSLLSYTESTLYVPGTRYLQEACSGNGDTFAVREQHLVE